MTDTTTPEPLHPLYVAGVISQLPHLVEDQQSEEARNTHRFAVGDAVLVRAQDALYVKISEERFARLEVALVPGTVVVQARSNLDLHRREGIEAWIRGDLPGQWEAVPGLAVLAAMADLPLGDADSDRILLGERVRPFLGLLRHLIDALQGESVQDRVEGKYARTLLTMADHFLVSADPDRPFGGEKPRRQSGQRLDPTPPRQRGIRYGG